MQRKKIIHRIQKQYPLPAYPLLLLLLFPAEVSPGTIIIIRYFSHTINERVLTGSSVSFVLFFFSSSSTSHILYMHGIRQVFFFLFSSTVVFKEPSMRRIYIHTHDPMPTHVPIPSVHTYKIICLFSSRIHIHTHTNIMQISFPVLDNGRLI